MSEIHRWLETLHNALLPVPEDAVRERRGSFRSTEGQETAKTRRKETRGGRWTGSRVASPPTINGVVVPQKKSLEFTAGDRLSSWLEKGNFAAAGFGSVQLSLLVSEGHVTCWFQSTKKATAAGPYPASPVISSSERLNTRFIQSE